MIQADFNIVFLFLGGGYGGVFVIAGSLKSFTLKLPIVTSIFLTFHGGAKAPLKCCMSAEFTYFLRFLSFNLLTKLAR